MTWTMKKKKKKAPGNTVAGVNTFSDLHVDAFGFFVRRFTRQNVLTYLVGSEAEARQRQRIGMEIVGKHRDR